MAHVTDQKVDILNSNSTRKQTNKTLTLHGIPKSNVSVIYAFTNKKYLSI